MHKNFNYTQAYPQFMWISHVKLWTTYVYRFVINRKIIIYKQKNKNYIKK